MFRLYIPRLFASSSIIKPSVIFPTSRIFSTCKIINMPESLNKQDDGQDPSVTKQWDDDVSLDQKMKDFGTIADNLKIGIMGTLRKDIGVSPTAPQASPLAHIH